jgi:hypothetical protein
MTRRGRPTTTIQRSSTNTCGVPVKFKQLHNYSFKVLPKSMKGRQRDTKEILTKRSGTSSTHSGAGCQLSIAIARTNPSSAEPQLGDPTGFFFAAMRARQAYIAEVGEQAWVGDHLGEEDQRTKAASSCYPAGLLRRLWRLHKNQSSGRSNKKRVTTHFTSEGVAQSKGLAMNLSGTGA